MNTADKKKDFLTCAINCGEKINLPQDVFRAGNKSIHFIGIGGIGMSGLAYIFAGLGYNVSGSDISNSKYLEDLSGKGVNIFVGHNASNINNVGAIVVSSAINEENPEIKEALDKKIPIFHRAQILSLLFSGQIQGQKQGITSIGVTGTHGKTTTSGLIGYMFEESGLDPNIVVGGYIPKLEKNSKMGNSNLFVAELDESDGTIVLYDADYTIITNLELDHHDHYQGGMEHLLETFSTYINNLKEDSKVIINVDCTGNRELISRLPQHKDKMITYSSDVHSEFYNSADFKATNIKLEGFNSSFDVIYKGENLGTANLIIPGEHNVSNALSAIAVGVLAGVDIPDMLKSISTFSGMKRRFQFLGEANGAKFFDDYAHHPTEIKKTLAAAKDIISKEAKGRVVALFQPHRYTRLSNLWHEFRGAFFDADVVYVTEVYAASETPIENINSVHFAESILHNNTVCVLGAMENVAEALQSKIKPGDMVITLGAGDITKLGGLLIKKING